MTDTLVKPLRCLPNFSSISGILQNLQWKAIKTQYKELCIIKLSKIIHRFVELPLPNYISLLHVLLDRKNRAKFVQPTMSIDSYKFSFFLNSITQ